MCMIDTGSVILWMVVRTTEMAARQGALGTAPSKASGRYRTKDPTRLGQHCIAISRPPSSDRTAQGHERSETTCFMSVRYIGAKNEVFPAQRRAGASDAATNTGPRGNLPMLSLGRSFSAELRKLRPEISKKLSKWYPMGRKQTNQTRSI